MKVCLVGGGSFEDFALNKVPMLKNADLICFCFGVFDEIFFQGELLGDSSVIESLVVLSRDFDCVVAAAANTDIYGKKRRSVIVCDSGRLIDAVDTTHNIDTDFDLSSVLRVFDTSKGKLGVLVDTDIFFFECSRALALSGADLILSIQGQSAPLGLLKTTALCNGLTAIECAQDFAAVCDCMGLVAYSAGGLYNVLEFEPVSDKTLLNSLRHDIKFGGTANTN